MPTVAILDGIKVQFYWDEHPPPHFHVEFGEWQAQVAIGSVRIIHGSIPTRQSKKVVDWAEPRTNELLEAWTKCQSDLHPGKIP
jgi:hypothetical protein